MPLPDTKDPRAQPIIDRLQDEPPLDVIETLTYTLKVLDTPRDGELILQTLARRIIDRLAAGRWN